MKGLEQKRRNSIELNGKKKLDEITEVVPQNVPTYKKEEKAYAGYDAYMKAVEMRGPLFSEQEAGKATIDIPVELKDSMAQNQERLKELAQKSRNLRSHGRGEL